MKRSQVIESIVYNCLSWDGLDTSGVPASEIANDVLTHIEKLGFKLVEEYQNKYDGSYFHEVPYEPEEGWDAWLEEQHKKDEARDFEVRLKHGQKSIHDFDKSQTVANLFLNGWSFEQLAQEYNVTRERIRQIVAKERRRFYTRSEGNNEK